MSKVVILGSAGRMGRTLIRCICSGNVPGLTLHGAVDLWDCPDREKDAGQVAGCGEIGVKICCDLKEVVPGSDVVVDFTGPHGTAGNAPRIAEWGKALVIGTTGLSPEDRAVIEQAASRIPIVLAPNMTLGINLLLALVEQGAAALKDKGFDIEVVERHHRRKKDSPSGTAIALGQAAAQGYGWDLKEVSVNGREGIVGERPAKEIGFHAVRGGDFVGDHTVIFAGEGESIEFSHRATSRDSLAMGALRAASWVVGRKPGLYSMRDVLGV
jgi:4-hydroxy-tetrahydrodipicolinate reductase